MPRPAALRRDLSEWLPEDPPVKERRAWRTVWLIPILLAGGAAAIATGPAGGVLAAVVAGAAEWAWVRLQGRLVLRSLGAVPLHSQEAPRLFNLAEGLAPIAGMEVPSLWLIPQGGPNALVCRWRGPVIAVSRSLLDGYTRTELEAVMAHCFIRLRDVSALSEAVALGPLGDKIALSVGFSHDAAAAALTRYPPAMARALVKAESRPDRFSALWFAGNDAFHHPKQTRTDMLLDL
jgi:hypothetical protein